jgi:hypothetical protein
MRCGCKCSNGGSCAVARRRDNNCTIGRGRRRRGGGGIGSCAARGLDGRGSALGPGDRMADVSVTILPSRRSTKQARHPTPPPPPPMAVYKSDRFQRLCRRSSEPGGQTPDHCGYSQASGSPCLVVSSGIRRRRRNAKGKPSMTTKNGLAPAMAHLVIRKEGWLCMEPRSPSVVLL